MIDENEANNDRLQAAADHARAATNETGAENVSFPALGNRLLVAAIVSGGLLLSLASFAAWRKRKKS